MKPAKQMMKELAELIDKLCWWMAIKTPTQMSTQTLNLIDKAYHHKKGTTYTTREKVCLVLFILFISGSLVTIGIFVAVMELREWINERKTLKKMSE